MKTTFESTLSSLAIEETIEVREALRVLSSSAYDMLNGQRWRAGQYLTALDAALKSVRSLIADVTRPTAPATRE
jgi:hypothetical protein